jgi:hypothetical protein
MTINELMSNPAKYEIIRKWVDPDERVTVDFLDEKNLDAIVTDCTPDHVDISVQTRFPHLKQHVSVPLSEVDIGEDRTHYTRDPAKPLGYGRLRMSLNMKRPEWT